MPSICSFYGGFAETQKTCHCHFPKTMNGNLNFLILIQVTTNSIRKKTSVVSLIMKVFFCFSPSFPLHLPPFLLPFLSPTLPSHHKSFIKEALWSVHYCSWHKNKRNANFNVIFVLYLCHFSQDWCKEGMMEIIWRKQFKISKQGSNNTCIYLVSLYLFGANQYLTWYEK